MVFDPGHGQVVVPIIDSVLSLIPLLSQLGVAHAKSLLLTLDHLSHLVYLAAECVIALFQFGTPFSFQHQLLLDVEVDLILGMNFLDSISDQAL